ncbi:hypothetical protein J6590_107273 [Homalodisca vitripennis]|nr:hypothetical protein J6590_107273 [Homalodisca vitripennis]
MTYMQELSKPTGVTINANCCSSSSAACCKLDGKPQARRTARGADGPCDTQIDRHHAVSKHAWPTTPTINYPVSSGSAGRGYGKGDCVIKNGDMGINAVGRVYGVPEKTLKRRLAGTNTYATDSKQVFGRPQRLAS